MPSKKKLLAAAALTASLTAGGAVGAMFGAPTLSSAQTQPDQGVERAERPAAERGHGGDIQPAPRQAQAGDERSADEGPEGGRPPGHHAHRVAFEAAADALRMTPEELKAELRDGKSVRAVAEARRIDVQTVIDAIVAAVTEHAEERATDFVDRVRPAGESDPDARQ
ncbi:MAG TPA: hypothetical protein VMY88_08055 [Acidimicrobiales bacterium]|nr:hypothetical protein [Acidimicrobiales bacterium]